MTLSVSSVLSCLLILLVSFGILYSGGCQSNNSRSWEVIKHDAKSMPGALWDDSKKLVSNTDNVVILLAAGGASGYVRCAHDDEIADHFKGHHTFGRDFTIGQGVIGSPVTHFSVAGLSYLYGTFGDYQEIHDVSSQLIEALSLTGLLTSGLKVIAQDDGPNDEKLAWPSGHTSSSVAFATILNEYYGPWVGVPLYGLCGFVMYERMETGEHWASDIVFGAVIGYTVSKTIADKYKPEILGMKVVPYTDPVGGSTGVAFVKTF